MNESGPSTEDLNQELQALLDYRHQVYVQQLEEQDCPVDPFQEVYDCLADTILAASRTYVGVRRLERVIVRELQEDE